MSDETNPERPPSKVKPEYAQGELVTVATAMNQPEAEFIANLLLEEGVPSLIQRTGGTDLPDYLAAGARVIRVPASGEAAARDILMEPDETPNPVPDTDH